MYIPSNCQNKQRHRWRPALVTMLMLTLAGLHGAAQAMEFDEKLKAPMMKSQGELHSQAQRLATQYRTLLETAPEQLIRNSALVRQQFDLKWQVQRAIDEHKPLEQLAALGIISQGNGSYGIDLGEHPEWNDLHETMAGFLVRADLVEVGPALISRGFRPEDVATLKAYVAEHNPDTAASAAALPVVVGFGRVVRKYDKLRRPVPEAVVVSFIYQRARAISESNRRWVAGLFERLDEQRIRIVMSSFTELKPTTVWIPENISQGIAEYLVLVRQPDFEARVTAESKGVAQ